MVTGKWKMVTKGDTVTKTLQIMNKFKSKKRKLVINVRNLLRLLMWHVK